MAFLCIDIGGTNTLIGAGNGGFEAVAEYRTERFLEELPQKVDQALENTHLSVEDIQQVAVAAAGPIDREEKLFYPPNVSNKRELEEVDLGEALKEFGEIKIINDCASAVLGEYNYGDHGSENIVYVTISSGIGAGAVLGGTLIEGADGNFAEVGHMKLREELECGCGGKGHWEAYCSGENLPRMAENLFNANYSDAREIFDRYDEGERKASEIIQKMNTMNAEGIANIATMYNPDRIVIGGAVALNHPEIVVDNLEAKVDGLTVNKTPDIGLCSLGEKAVLHGLRAVCNGDYSKEN